MTPITQSSPCLVHRGASQTYHTIRAVVFFRSCMGLLVGLYIALLCGHCIILYCYLRLYSGLIQTSYSAAIWALCCTVMWSLHNTVLLLVVLYGHPIYSCYLGSVLPYIIVPAFDAAQWYYLGTLQCCYLSSVLHYYAVTVSNTMDWYYFGTIWHCFVPTV